MKRRSFHRPPLTTTPIILPILLFALILCFAGLSVTSPPRPPADMDEFVALLARTDPNSLERARSFVNTHRTPVAQRLRSLLNDADWRVRANACLVAADLHDETALRSLVPRASDSDSRVRSKAFGALSRFSRLSFWPPQRNTPLHEREINLLAWIADGDRAGRSLGTQLCELYAGTSYVEFGQPLAARCLACHAGSPNRAFTTADACRRCHQQIHADWSRSAHANSLSHLHLQTVDAETRQTRWVDFGASRGIVCTECHRLASDGPRQSPATQGSAQCRYQFDTSSPAGESCLRCHADIQRQWQRWLTGPQARRLEWPPGELDVSAQGDRRTCIDCHMPPAPVAGAAPRDHRWSARRDLQLLARGLDVRIVQSGGEAPNVSLVLTNLAGHDYPAGTCRRSVEVYAGSDEPGMLPRVAVLARVCPGESEGAFEPALAPGEQREFPLALPMDAHSVAYRVIYVRDRGNAASYTAEIRAGVRELTARAMP